MNIKPKIPKHLEYLGTKNTHHTPSNSCTGKNAHATKYQTNETFMKYVKFTLKEMTPEQLKQNPITVHPNQKVDTDEGESTKVQEEFTTSEELTEEYSTFLDMSKQNSESDLMLMILNIQKIHIHLKHCKTTQQCMIKMI